MRYAVNLSLYLEKQGVAPTRVKQLKEEKKEQVNTANNVGYPDPYFFNNNTSEAVSNKDYGPVSSI